MTARPGAVREFYPLHIVRQVLTGADITHLPPEQLAESILTKERGIAEILTTIKNLLTGTK